MAMSRSSKGFSLIELLTTVLIIGILAAIAIPAYTKYIKKSRVSEAVTNLVAIDTYEETYFSENDQYLCLEANPPSVPQNTHRENFASGLTSWSDIGRVIATNTPLNFQYQAYAGKFGTAPALTAQDGLCVSNYTQAFTPGATTCSNTVSASNFSIPLEDNSHFFFVTAVSDQDGDGNCSLIVKVINRPDIFKQDEIE